MRNAAAVFLAALCCAAASAQTAPVPKPDPAAPAAEAVYMFEPEDSAGYKEVLRLDSGSAEAKETLGLDASEENGGGEKQALEPAVPEKDDGEDKDAMSAVNGEREGPASKSKKYRARFGIRGAWAYEAIYLGLSQQEDYKGQGYGGGLALSVPLSGRVTLELEADYRCRELSQERSYEYVYRHELTGIAGSGARRTDLVLTEQAIRVPVLVKVYTAPLPEKGSPVGFGVPSLYIEGGFQLGFPFETILEFKDSDLGPMKVDDRNIDLQCVFGAGFSFRAGMMVHIGYRGIVNITNFAGDVGWFAQFETGLSLMF